MVNRYQSAVRVGLACFLLVCGAAWNPAQAGKSTTLPVGGATGQTGQTGQTTLPVAGATGQTGQTTQPVAGVSGKSAPTVTASLVVNGTAAACGAVVSAGAQVCLQFTSDQSGTAVISIQKGTASSLVASGSVTGGTAYNVCVTAGAADGLTRVFTVTVTNSAGQSSSQQCAYVVGPVGGATGGKGGKGGPTITPSLLVNGTAAACGAVVSSGAQVCLQFSSDQSGTAVITVQSGTTTSTLASGSVTAGTTYSVCVTAGAADGLTRIFTVTVTNSAGQSTSQQCSYLVAPVSGATGGKGGKGGPTITPSLLVNGTAAACGAVVTAGAQVCLQFTSDQSGTAVISIQNGSATSTLASGSVTAGTAYNVCVTAGAGDGLTRVFTVTVTNSAGQSSSQQCSYLVSAVSGATGGKTGQLGGQTGQTGQTGTTTTTPTTTTTTTTTTGTLTPVGTATPTGTTGPTITDTLLVNSATAACGSAVTAGSQVCVQFTSDQSGNAVVTAASGTGTPTTLANGPVTAGTAYNVCATAGTATGVQQTFTVMVTTSSGQSSSQQCAYMVQ